MAKQIVLDDSHIPTQWYNAVPDIPGGLEPPLDPATGKPLSPKALSALFPEPLIEQEVSPQRFIDIPDEVRQLLAIWRPTPLVRADRLEKAVGAKARIYFKNESLSPPGSHKGNTAVAQAYANRQAGVKRLTTETGGGQWGSAISMAAKFMGLECRVYMVRSSYGQKPFRKSVMQLFGAEVVPSPSPSTATGSAILKEDPGCPGSLGIAISEAVEDALASPGTKYTLGSVLNHVLLHQTVIGLEAKEQLKKAGEKLPDIVIACCGGGSNFSGIALPFLPERLAGKAIRLVGVEPSACPTLTRGHYAYDYGDTAQLTPLVKMHTLGAHFVPNDIHAGGLRYHGMAPIVSALVRDGLVEPRAFPQTRCFQAAALFAQTEGIIPAPESAHAIATAVDEAVNPENEGKVVLFNLSGHGLLDMYAYDRYTANEIKDLSFDEKALRAAEALLPKVE